MVVTGESFQFAARRLRVFERGVFHLGFAMIAFHIGAVASTTRVFPLSARRTQTATVFIAHKAERECRRYKLSHEVAQIEIRAVQYVIVTKGIARPAGRIEAFVDVDVDRNEHIVQAPVAFAGNADIDRTADLQSFFHPTHFERDLCRSRKCERPKCRNHDRVFERDRPSCVQ